MKYLVILVLVLVVAWFWRNGRRSDAAERKGTKPAPPAQQDMVQCPVCSVHLPRTDALAGPDGRLYCCAEHRLRDGP
ncbi:MAG: PP0621 family protein [Ramlibacter sp.]